jgi:hypothetical protein
MRAEFMTFMEKFNITDLGPLSRALGADITQNLQKGETTFALTGYIRDAARRLDIPDKHVATPATRQIYANIKLDTVRLPPDEADKYLVLSGILTFIASTARPDISWYTVIGARGNSKPTAARRAFLIHIMQYLVTTADLALTYRRSASYNTGCIFRPGDDPPTAQPHAVGDAGLSSPKSTSAWSFFVAGAAVFWKVMAQLDPSLSSGEAEFYALTSAIATAIHMRQLMEELQYVWLSPTLVFTDGRAAKLMVKDGNSTPSVRHIDLKWWFANHHVDVGNVSIATVRGVKNPVNGMTKLTLGTQFLAERSYLLGLLPEMAASAQLLQSFGRILGSTTLSNARALAATIISRAWRTRVLESND